MKSPWWYRGRSPIFGAIYITGFAGGAFAMRPHSYEPAFAAFGPRLGDWGAPVLLIVAVLFTVACIAVRAWGSSYLSAAVVWNADARTDALIVAGPFRYTRNPLYFGNVLLSIGFALLAPVPGLIFILVADTLFVLALIGHEESLMLRRYGDAFREYCTKVPALFPRLTPVAARSDLQPSAAQGALSELFTAAIAVGLFAWILVPPYGRYIFVAMYFAGVLAQRAVERAND